MMELNKEALKGHIDTIILSILNEKDCYGYIPCVQLSVCWYWMGDLKKALKYHRLAGKYKPYGAAFLRNQQYFEN